MTPSSPSPNLPRGVRRLFRLPTSRARLLRDADDEIRAHLEMRVADLVAQGMTPADARAEALRRFGDADELRADEARRAVRRAWRHAVGEWLAGWWQDVRFAARQSRKHAGFTALAVATLALGIGANSAIFTVVHKLLIAPLPYPDGDRIVLLAIEDEGHVESGPDAVVAKAWRARARSFATIGSVQVDAIMTQEVGEMDTVAAFITPSYLDVLGVRPVLGRRLTEADARPGAPSVAMITYGLWQRRFGGGREAIGARVEADGQTFTVVGVTPKEMGIPMTFSPAGMRLAAKRLHEATPSIWAPVSPDSARGMLFARLRPGVSPDEASRELQQISATTPVPPPPPGAFRAPKCCARAWRAQDLVDPRETSTVEILFVAVGVLLLIACANVANLLMARAWTRRREFAVRTAIGAGRARLVRLVLTEGLLLAVAGGALGVLLAWEAVRGIIALRPPALENLAGVHLDPAVLVWSLGISVCTGLLFGTAPALLAGDRSLGAMLRGEGHGGSSDSAARRVRSALIVGEIALSLVLLTGAGLLVRSFAALQRTPLGFEPRGLVSIDVLMPPRPFPMAARPALARVLLERLRGVPGVTEAAIGTMPTIAYHALGANLETEPDASGQSRHASEWGLGFMSPNYLHVARIALLAGQLPDSAWYTPTLPPALRAARPGAPAAPEDILVNRALERRLFPDGGAIGARVVNASDPSMPARRYTVIGVVADARVPGASAGAEPMIYTRPFAITLPLVARVRGSPASVAAAARRALHEADRRIVVQTVIVGDDYLRDTLAPTRFAMVLLATFAGIAVLLAAIGLYGVIAYSVTQRSREIGVRIALGAEPRAVTTLVMGDGVRLVVAGVVLGSAGAVLATRSLRGLLYGVSPADPATYGGIVVLVVAIALLASYLPARRALRIDPLEVLRSE